MAGLVSLAIFVVVWFSGHVVNVLCFLNPIPFLDTALKGMRLAAIGVVGGALSALYPGYRAAKLDPAIALSYE